MKISVIWYDSPSSQASRPSLDHLYPFGTAPSPRRSPNPFIKLCTCYIQGPSRRSPNTFIKLCIYYIQSPSFGGPRILSSLCTYYFQGPFSAVPKPTASSRFAHIIFRASPRLSPNCYVRNFFFAPGSAPLSATRTPLSLVCKIWAPQILQVQPSLALISAAPIKP